MSASRRSLLQAIILIQLDEEPARTITELAEQVKAQRPSVSRSLRILKQQNLVRRNHAGWSLTDEGKLEAEEAKIAVAKMAETAQSMVVRTNEMMSRLSEAALASLGGLDTAALVAPYNEMMNRLSESARVFDTAALVESSIDKIAALSDPMRPYALEAASSIVAGKDIAVLWGAATAPILDVGRYNLRLMDEVLQFRVPSYFEEFTRQNSALLAHITDNLFEARQLQLNAGTMAPDFSDLIRQTTRVNAALDGVWRQSLKDIVSPVALPAADVLGMKITLPTRTVAHYTGAVIAQIQEEAGNDIELSVAYEAQEELGDCSLDPLLENLNPDFVEMRRGSWSALFSDGYDRLRHAAISQRELLCQVLQKLVPDTQLPEDFIAGKPHIKARVKVALGGSKTDAEYVIAMSVAMLAQYEQLNKYTHQNRKHEVRVRGILRAGEGLLLSILSVLELSDGGQ